MKYIFGILITIILTNLYSCKKKLSNNEKIIGTWVGSPKEFGGYAGHTDTFIFMPDSNLNLVSSALDVLSQKGNMKYFFDKNNLMVKVTVSSIPYNQIFETHFEEHNKIHLIVSSLVGDTHFFYTKTSN